MKKLKNQTKISQFVSLSHEEIQLVYALQVGKIHVICTPKMRENVRRQFTGTRPSLRADGSADFSPASPQELSRYFKVTLQSDCYLFRVSRGPFGVSSSLTAEFLSLAERLASTAVVSRCFNPKGFYTLHGWANKGTGSRVRSFCFLLVSGEINFNFGQSVSSLSKSEVKI